MPIALFGPIAGEGDPQYRRGGIGNRHPEVANAYLAADRGHDRLERGIPRGGDEHRREQEQKLDIGKRGGADRGALCAGLGRLCAGEGWSVGHDLPLERDGAKRKPRRWNLLIRAAFANEAAVRLHGAFMNLSTARALKSPRRFARKRLTSPKLQFLKEFFKHPVMVGSVIPSSDRLIDRMLAPVDWANTRLFVEYGPGVGTFTRPILDRLGPEATLITIDTNADFTPRRR